MHATYLLKLTCLGGPPGVEGFQTCLSRGEKVRKKGKCFSINDVFKNRI